MAWNQVKIDETFRQIQNLSSSDEIFRAELLDNPVSAIEKLAGEKLPDGFKINVIERDPAYALTFVLPPLITNELTDDTLENVAGGMGEEMMPDFCSCERFLNF